MTDSYLTGKKSCEVLALLHHLVNCSCSSLRLDKDHECTTQLQQYMFSCTEDDHDPAAAVDRWDRIIYEHPEMMDDTKIHTMHSGKMSRLLTTSTKSTRLCYFHHPTAFALHWWNYGTPTLCAVAEMMMYV